MNSVFQLFRTDRFPHTVHFYGKAKWGKLNRICDLNFTPGYPAQHIPEPGFIHLLLQYFTVSLVD